MLSEPWGRVDDVSLIELHAAGPEGMTMEDFVVRMAHSYRGAALETDLHDVLAFAARQALVAEYDRALCAREQLRHRGAAVPLDTQIQHFKLGLGLHVISVP